MNLDRILEKIAVQNGVSVSQIRRDIQEALDEGWNSNDKNVREYWQKIPSKDKKPTLEEVILYIVAECIK